MCLRLNWVATVAGQRNSWLHGKFHEVPRKDLKGQRLCVKSSSHHIPGFCFAPPLEPMSHFLFSYPLQPHSLNHKNLCQQCIASKPHFSLHCLTNGLSLSTNTKLENYWLGIMQFHQSVCLYIYVCTHIYMCVCVYMYMYIYTHAVQLIYSLYSLIQENINLFTYIGFNYHVNYGNFAHKVGYMTQSPLV